MSALSYLQHELRYFFVNWETRAFMSEQDMRILIVEQLNAPLGNIPITIDVMEERIDAMLWLLAELKAKTLHKHFARISPEADALDYLASPLENSTQAIIVLIEEDYSGRMVSIITPLDKYEAERREFHNQFGHFKVLLELAHDHGYDLKYRDFTSQQEFNRLVRNEYRGGVPQEPANISIDR